MRCKVLFLPYNISPTRGENTLDLILTNLPGKFENAMGFDDVLFTDHEPISVDINFKNQRKPKLTYLVYNFRKANWTGLKCIRIIDVPSDRARNNIT